LAELAENPVAIWVARVQRPHFVPTPYPHPMSDNTARIHMSPKALRASARIYPQCAKHYYYDYYL
jgi:hypothetical protein